MDENYYVINDEQQGEWDTAFKIVQDSGQMQSFDTGSVRDTREGKGRFDLVSPIALKRIAQHYENGGKKYSDRNWEKGQPVMRSLDSAIRHINTLIEYKQKGMALDEDHLAAACWNLMAIMHVEEMVRCGLLPCDLIDYPKPFPKIEARPYNDPRNAKMGVTV